MDRSYYLAAAGLKMPIGTHLVLLEEFLKAWKSPSKPGEFIQQSKVTAVLL